MKKIFFIAAVMFLCAGGVYSQDTTKNFHIKTDAFNLTAEYLEYFVTKSLVTKSILITKEFSDCTELIQKSDSGFAVKHKSGYSSLLYKDINQITFYGKRKFLKGLKWGAITGAGVGVAALIAISAFTKNSSGDAKIAYANYEFLTIPVCTLIGTILGGVIGVLSFEKEEYDFTKYSANIRKEMVCKLLLKHQLNF